MTAYDIIIAPVLSEKSYDGIPEKRYTFRVLKTANKTQIKAAVEEIFGVKVAKVNTLRLQESDCHSHLRQQGNRVLREHGIRNKEKRICLLKSINRLLPPAVL